MLLWKLECANEQHEGPTRCDVLRRTAQYLETVSEGFELWDSAM